MSSTSEVGHAKNVAHFGDLIAYCTAYGATYNPPKPALQINSLNTLLTSVRTELDNVITAKNAFDTVTADRQVSFIGQFLFYILCISRFAVLYFLVLVLSRFGVIKNNSCKVFLIIVEPHYPNSKFILR